MMKLVTYIFYLYLYLYRLSIILVNKDYHKPVVLFSEFICDRSGFVNYTCLSESGMMY